MNPDVCIPQDRLAEFCRANSITELSVFGSVLRDDFGPQSDIDLLVSFEEEAHHTLFDLIRMEEELETMLGRKVDLVSRRGIERSPNYLRRKAILESAELIYSAGKCPAVVGGDRTTGAAGIGGETAMTIPKPGAKRRLGFMEGQIEIPDDFDHMHADDIVALFEGDDVPTVAEAKASGEGDTE